MGTDTIIRDIDPIDPSEIITDDPSDIITKGDDEMIITSGGVID